MHIGQGAAYMLGVTVQKTVIDLRSHFRQRRSHLVRGVGDELLAALQHLRQSVGVKIQRVDQWTNLALNVAGIDRRSDPWKAA